jgi:hypothetical protein
VKPVPRDGGGGGGGRRAELRRDLAHRDAAATCRRRYHEATEQYSEAEPRARFLVFVPRKLVCERTQPNQGWQWTCASSPSSCANLSNAVVDFCTGSGQNGRAELHAL